MGLLNKRKPNLSGGIPLRSAELPRFYGSEKALPVDLYGNPATTPELASEEGQELAMKQIAIQGILINVAPDTNARYFTDDEVLSALDESKFHASKGTVELTLPRDDGTFVKRTVNRGAFTMRDCEVKMALINPSLEIFEVSDHGVLPIPTIR